MQRRQELLQAFIKRLVERWAKDGTQDAPGLVVNRPVRVIRDGYYNAEPEDTRPDFVKQDTEGWEPL